MTVPYETAREMYFIRPCSCCSRPLFSDNVEDRPKENGLFVCEPCRKDGIWRFTRLFLIGNALRHSRVILLRAMIAEWDQQPRILTPGGVTLG